MSRSDKQRSFRIETDSPGRLRFPIESAAAGDQALYDKSRFKMRRREELLRSRSTARGERRVTSL